MIYVLIARRNFLKHAPIHRTLYISTRLLPVCEFLTSFRAWKVNTEGILKIFEDIHSQVFHVPLQNSSRSQTWTMELYTTDQNTFILDEEAIR
jgi:hypothetical protein